MSPHTIRRLFPNASKSVLAANSADYGPSDYTGPTPEPQRHHAKGAVVESPETQAASPARFHLRIVSVRKRLLDPDNLVPKWTIDALRYCGIIPGDEPDKLTLEIGQRKAAKGEQEHTELTLTKQP